MKFKPIEKADKPKADKGELSAISNSVTLMKL